MRDDIGMFVWLAADRGDTEMIEYLLSSYGSIINVNVQDKVGLKSSIIILF